MSKGRDTVLIVGCGYSGAQLAQDLCFRGIPVVGTTRNETQASVIRTRGAQPMILDLKNLEPLKRVRGKIQSIVYSVPPQRNDAGQFDEPLLNFIEAMKDEPIEKFVYISSTSVYGDRGGDRVDEHTEVAPDSPRGEARVRAERALLESPLPACIVRPSGIYGPGRSLLQRLAKRNYRLVAGGHALTNRIHVVDLCRIIAKALKRGEPGQIYLASDAEPTSQATVAHTLCEAYQLPAPPEMPLEEAQIRLIPSTLKMLIGSKYIDSSWTLEKLGLRLRFPSYRDGYQALWRQEESNVRNHLKG